MLSRLFRALGFVRVDQYTAIERQLRKAQAHAAELGESVEEAKREIREWRTKGGATERHIRHLEREMANQTAHAEKVKAELSERVAELHDALRRRLVASERDRLVARDHLMAIEVKLDILEGAANVLDGRTRTVLEAQRQRETGAPV